MVFEGGLLIRDHTHLAPAGYEAFAQRFGDDLDLHSRRDLCHKDHHALFIVGNVVEAGKPVGAPKVGLNWHTDHYHLEHAGLFTFLHAITVPPVSGATRYANGIAAWEALPEETRQRVAGLKLLHSRRRLFRELFADATEEQCQAAARKFPDVIHPLVRAHP